MRVLVHEVLAVVVMMIGSGIAVSPATGMASFRRTRTFAIGATSHSLTVDGRERTYRLYRPAGINGAAPLVVMLHGGFGSAKRAEQSYGWDAEADREHFIVAYPDGLNHAWNTGGGCCGEPARQNIDDIAFITAMIEQIETDIAIDPERIFAAGMSNGGIMAYTLACRTDMFAAIGPVAATMLGDCPSPHPLSVIHIHGSADTNIPYAGGTGSGVAAIDGPSVPNLNATWRQIDACGSPGVTVDGIVTTSLAQCADGRAVELITVADAGHQWPGSTPKPLLQKILQTDPPSPALDATSVIWQFFADHPRH